MGFDVRNHHLVYNHSKASEVEKEALLKRYNITIRDLPKILRQDPAIAALNPAEGDVIKIERISKTAGKTEYYRQVMES